jgi:hypothetical protein
MAERQLNTLPPPVEFAAQRRGSVYRTYPARQPTELEQVAQRRISLGNFLQLSTGRVFWQDWSPSALLQSRGPSLDLRGRMH